MKEVIRVEEQYYVLATAAHDDRTRVLKHGDTFALFNRSGNVRTLGLHDQGLYHDGTRFLSRLNLQLCGQNPLLLSSSVVASNTLLTVDMTNPDIQKNGEVTIPHGTLHLLRTKFLLDGQCYEKLSLQNFGSRSVKITLDLEFEADFRDIFEIRGTVRSKRGDDPKIVLEDGGVRIAYVGLDGVTRTSRIFVEPKPATLSESDIGFEAELKPGEEKVFFFTVDCAVSGERRKFKGTSFDHGFLHAKKEMAETRFEECRLGSSSVLFNRWLERSVADLRMMVTQTPHGLYPYAGVPWYSVPFGRDAIVTALQTLWLKPTLSAGVLRFLAATQADETDPERDAEPGKIVHEMRKGEMAATGEIPFGRYYGTIDSTPLFLLLAGKYFEATADVSLIESIWPNIERALFWIKNHGDVDGDGFIEYAQRSKRGLQNQGWKDSVDAVFHADGQLAEGSIALCEVQAYVYAAKQSVSKMAAAMGKDALAFALAEEAEDLRKHFEAVYWCEDLSSYAIALDGEKRLCRVRTSNAGHCLFGGIASPERASRLTKVLTGPSFESGWGIRTVADSEVRYNPMSYHNGSVWPHDNALCALGFAQYGHTDASLKVTESLFDSSAFFEMHRLPELFCGFPRRPGEGPTHYPVACSPQAWASGSVLMMLQACFGIELDAVNKTLRLIRPKLPHFLERVELRRLKVGEATLDLTLHRYPEGAGVDVPRQEGELEVVIVK